MISPEEEVSPPPLISMMAPPHVGESPTKRPKPGASVTAVDDKNSSPHHHHNNNNSSKPHVVELQQQPQRPSAVSNNLDDPMVGEPPAELRNIEGVPNVDEAAGGGEPATVVAAGHLTRVRVGMTLRHWTITSRIGAGSFGETFVGQDKGESTDSAKYEKGLSDGDQENGPQSSNNSTNNKPRPHEVCIKVEQESKNVLRIEVLALKRVQQCPQVVRYVASGRFMDANYLVMERLGQNLVDVRRMCPRGVFTIHTTLRVGISCLKAIQGVHELGLVHRDIKPSNFVIGLKGEAVRTCYLIDFGLARRYRRSNGEVRPARDETGFRGTSRYASLQSHRHQDLGRVDDLWSLLFMLIEFATGTLPWRKFKDKDDIGRCKEMCIGPQLVKHMPREFGPFLEHLESCSYASEPDYSFLLSLLYRSLERRGYPPNKPLEWEEYLLAEENGCGGEAGQEDSAPKVEEGGPSPPLAAPAAPHTTARSIEMLQPHSTTPPIPLPPHKKTVAASNYQESPAHAVGGDGDFDLPDQEQEEDVPASKLAPALDGGDDDAHHHHHLNNGGSLIHTGGSLRPPLMAPSLSPEPHHQVLPASRTVLPTTDSTPTKQQHQQKLADGDDAGGWPEDGGSQSRPEVRTKFTLHVEQVEMKLGGGGGGVRGRSPDSSNVLPFSAAPAADNPLSARKHDPNGASGANGAHGAEGAGSSTNSTSKSAFSPRCHNVVPTAGGELQLVDEQEDEQELLQHPPRPGGNTSHNRVGRAPPTQLRSAPPTAAATSHNHLHQCQPIHQPPRFGDDDDEEDRDGGSAVRMTPAGPSARARSDLPPTAFSANGSSKPTGPNKKSTEEETTMCSCSIM